MKNPSELHTYRHLWGVNLPLEQAAIRFKEQGYHGLESHFGNAAARRHARNTMEAHGLKNIAMAFTQPDPISGHSVAAHLKSLELDLAAALETNPTCIVVHAGYDAWHESDALRFFQGALEQVLPIPVPVGFETHRGRCLNTPWATLKVLKQFPELKLTLDLSHWVLVCERFPDDQPEALEQAIEACVHIHARVGHPQAPQVNDPRAPEHSQALEWYEQQWSKVWAAQRKRGEAISSLTPEFGPPDYQPTLPYTNMPLSDLETVCNWMRDRLLERF
jgi:sugar phosphate isomerase/epimerase